MRLVWRILITVSIGLLPSLAFADGGTLYISPALGTYSIGQTFTVQVLVDTGGASINAAEARLSFDPSNLEVENISKDGSIFGSWPSEPQFSNASGTISFTGWARQPYIGKNGLLASITFKALRDADANARFAAGAILATQGGSNIISSMQSAAYTIHPADIAPTSSNAILRNQVATSSPSDSANTSTDVQSRTLIFTQYDKEIHVGQPIIVRGIAEPDAELKISIQEDEGSASHIALYAGADGSFTYASAPTTKAGDYRIWAAMREGDTFTVPIPAITIRAKDSMFSEEVSLASNLAFDFLPYVFLIAVIGPSIGYLQHHRRIQKVHSHRR